MSKLNSAIRYADSGFSVFPCKANSKTPALRGWQEAATTDIEVIQRWWCDNPDYNIGVVADRHIVLDVDLKPSEGMDGFNSLRNHERLPDTFTVHTPSGGMHFYFVPSSQCEMTICQGFEPGLDIRAGGKGYTIGAGSVIDGLSYTTDCDDFFMAPAPDWVQEAAQKTKTATTNIQLKVQSREHDRPSLDQINEALAELDPDMPYEQWIKIGMAIHSAYPDRSGLEAWNDWSSSGDKYEQDECSRHWSGFNDRGGITIATLFHYSLPSYRTDDDGLILHLHLVGENDTTIAEAFVSSYRSRVVYDATNKQWRVFESGKWIGAEAAEKLVYEYYNSIILMLKQEVEANRVHNHLSISLKWLNKAMNQAIQSSVLKIVQVSLAEKQESFDANLDLIGMGEWVYEIPTAQVRQTEGKDFILRSVGVDYDASATCPNWDGFLNEIMQRDVEMIAYLQRLAGYLLTGSVTEQEIYFFYGSGSNGKSTFLDVIKALLGDYAVKISSDSITKAQSRGRSNGANADIAKLAGARLGMTDEMRDDTATFDTQVLKSISGDDEITARLLYRNPITFKSTAKIVMYGNDKPYGNINDEGFWRRLRFIHFYHVIPAEDRDKDLLPRLKSELSGILNWALAGLAEWQQIGLATPQKVLDDSVDYRKDLDSITEYFVANLKYDPHATITTKGLYEGYLNWCDENLVEPYKKHSFSRKAASYFADVGGVSPYKTSKSRGYKGVAFS